MRKTWLPPGVALVVWLLKSLYIGVTPIESLARTCWLLDDAFIIMKVARSLGHGSGFTYDGVQLTTGVPLLWTLIVAPLHAISSLVVGAKLTCMLSALFGALSALLVHRLAQRLHGTRVAWLAFGLITLLASPFFNAMNGMETSLFTLLFVSSMSAYVTWSRSPGRGEGVRLGVLLGLLNLTRFDGGVLTIVVLGREVWIHRRAPFRLVPLLAAVTVVTLPLLVWNAAVNGTVMPANQAGRMALAWEKTRTAEGAWMLGPYVAKIGLNLVRFFDLVGAAIGSAWLAGLACGWGARRSPFVQVTLGYAALYFVLLVFYQGYFPNVHGLRYLNPLAHLAIIPVSAFVLRILDEVGGARLRSASVIVFAAVFLAGGFVHYWQVATGVSIRDPLSRVDAQLDRVLPNPRHEVRDGSFWALARWLDENLPDGTPVACKDHGRFAYFTNIRIVDLAGIIQPEISEYVRKRSLVGYLATHDVRYAILPERSQTRAQQLIREGMWVEPVALPPGIPRHLHVLVPKP